MSGNIYDVLVVGAGPAGLTAATYLARFHRRVLVADGGPPRAAWIPRSHNAPGFPAGVGGDEMLARMRAQAERYGAEIRPGRVDALSGADGDFAARLGAAQVRARKVLLATGVVDRHPDLPGVERAIERGVVRICPICDAFEASDSAIAVIGDGDGGAREAAFLRTYSDRVTLIHTGRPDALGARAEMERLGVAVVDAPIEAVALDGDRVTALTWGGESRRFDVVYSALGCTPSAELARQVGAGLDAEGRLLTDAHQQTSTPGLYAAGDVVRGLNQIAVATGEAALAATDIHNRLREAEGRVVVDR